VTGGNDRDRKSVERLLATLDITSQTTLSAPALPPDGDSLARFVLLGELGRGGMGRVIEAVDPDLGRAVAIKVVIDPEGVSRGQLARFVAEARVTAQLEHPNIVPIYETGITEDGQVFFVMRKVQGRSLRDLLEALGRGEPEAVAGWSRHRLLRAFVQVCNAVAFAHSRGVLHRDLKPDNVMLGAFGEVLLLDWGVARTIGGPPEAPARPMAPVAAPGLTADGTSVGTPGYMSPEQAQAQPLDERSDVFSLGSILYEILASSRAYGGDTAIQVLFQSLEGPPQDPRERAPGRAIPDELAACCMRAMSPTSAERHPSAAALAADVEAWLEGSRRRDRAAAQLQVAADALARYGELKAEESGLGAEETRLASVVSPAAPRDDDGKARLLTVRERLEELVPEANEVFARAVGEAEGALVLDPDNPDARALLADAWWTRLEEAEASGDRFARGWAEDRVRRYDDGRYAFRLRGIGSLSLTTDPPGASVVARSVKRKGLIWGSGRAQEMGRTPVREGLLGRGSWILTLSAPGRVEVRYPVTVARGGDWTGPTVRLPAVGEIPDGFRYVPAGPFQRGARDRAQHGLPAGRETLDAFLIAELPVTVEQYCRFLNAVAQVDPELAWGRVPRLHSGLEEGGGQYWERPATGQPYVPPERDAQGDRWDPRWPVLSVSWFDAVAFARWRSEQDGVAWRLPTEREWEKAARGVDGRVFPWGDSFDPTTCVMKDSFEGNPEPLPVGSARDDVSVYGVRDLAGSAREWCADVLPGRGDGLRPIRGGSWWTAELTCRADYRLPSEPGGCNAYTGFRLARSFA